MNAHGKKPRSERMTLILEQLLIALYNQLVLKNKFASFNWKLLYELIHGPIAGAAYVIHLLACAQLHNGLRSFLNSLKAFRIFFLY